VCTLLRSWETSRSGLPSEGERDVGENQPSFQDRVSWCGLTSSGLQNLECTTTLGDNPERLGSEASFASLCGVSPVEASSGKVVRHRLNLM
jgi:hypothetical protein